MDGSSKCPRRLKKDTTVFLNDLPDEILLRIISFLPTKSAVATSLLSRRWQYLWTSTPNLQLDESLFDDRNQFMNFAERALILRAGSSLVSFSLELVSVPLECRGKEDESRIKSWITSAVRYNVEQLSLKLCAPVGLPFCVFGCQSLVKLFLSMCYIRFPSMVWLPRLKHLTLELVLFDDKESTEKLLSHPLLEELTLSCCEWSDVTTVNVNSPNLQSLAIEDECDYWWEGRQICFFGDNLKLFRYNGVLPPTQYCICGSTMQLKEAEISVDQPYCEVQKFDAPSNRYCKLINSLSMVQTLTLSNNTVESLYRLSQCPLLQTTLLVFERVTRLNLECGYDRTTSVDSEEFTMLYKRCPHLENLNFMTMIKLDHIRKDMPILRPMPSCFRTHLKKVTIQSYEPECDDEDINDQAINLIFNSAPVLEQVVIYWERDGRIPGDDSKAVELERKLNARPKVSENCRVSVVLV